MRNSEAQHSSDAAWKLGSTRVTRAVVDHNSCFKCQRTLRTLGELDASGFGRLTNSDAVWRIRSYCLSVSAWGEHEALGAYVDVGRILSWFYQEFDPSTRVSAVVRGLAEDRGAQSAIDPC